MSKLSKKVSDNLVNGLTCRIGNLGDAIKAHAYRDHSSCPFCIIFFNKYGYMRTDYYDTRLEFEKAMRAISPIVNWKANSLQDR